MYSEYRLFFPTLPDFKPKTTRQECKLWDRQLLIHIARKSTPRFTKSPSFVLIRLVLTEIQRFRNVKINKEMYGHPDAVFARAQRPDYADGHTFLSNACFLPTVGSIYTKLKAFVKLDLHIMTMWINSC